jgi:hypothetical protein
MRLALALALVLLLASPAFAFNEPDGFRGLKWGATKDDLDAAAMKRGDATVLCPPSRPPHAICSTEVMIGPAPAMVDYRFRDERFVAVSVRFQPDQFSGVAETFILRYGPPTKRSQEPVQTRGGARLTNDILRWTGKAVVIELRRYAASADEGSAYLWTQAEFARMLAERDKAIKKGKDDL